MVGSSVDGMRLPSTPRQLFSSDSLYQVEPSATGVQEDSPRVSVLVPPNATSSSLYSMRISGV